ncbi:hypothetical protein FQN60_000026, partial [Etheostoma spectabile]
CWIPVCVELFIPSVFQEQQIDDAEGGVFSVPSYACLRRTTLENHNPVLTMERLKMCFLSQDALSLLAENAELSDEDGRGVAFRRAAAVLKALPEPVTGAAQLRGLPCLGGHSLRVITVLTGIFGVGAKTAERWIRDGIHNLHQLQESGQALNRAQQAGLDHYDDLQQPVTRAEADAIGEVVEEAVVSVLPGAQITLIGGFRRGKLTGHDVDFLITHPEEGREGFLLYQKTTRNSYLEAKAGPARPPSNMDRFERCFSIFKLADAEKRGRKRAGNAPEDTCCPAAHSRVADEGPEPVKPAGGPGRWRAVRVDLVVSPVSQFAFALLGWTGSKVVFCI